VEEGALEEGSEAASSAPPCSREQLLSVSAPNGESERESERERERESERKRDREIESKKREIPRRRAWKTRRKERRNLDRTVRPLHPLHPHLKH
jgi:hypothetical protein